MESRLVGGKEFVEDTEDLLSFLSRSRNCERIFVGVPLVDSLSSGQGFGGGDILELCGASGTGKTEILLQIISAVLIPSQYEGLRLLGRGSGVIFIDTAFAFDILRLEAILERSIRQRLVSCAEQLAREGTRAASSNQAESTASSDTNVQDLHRKADICEMLLSDGSARKRIVQSCLKRLWLFRVRSRAELALTIRGLVGLLAQEPNILLLAWDSISTFDWLDRGDEQRAHRIIISNSAGAATPFNPSKYKSSILTYMRQMMREYNLFCVATRIVYGTENVPPEWERVVSCRLSLKLKQNEILYSGEGASLRSNRSGRYRTQGSIPLSSDFGGIVLPLSS